MFGIDDALIFGGLSAAANLGGSFMSAQGAAQANAQNQQMNWAQMNFQNNVNAANWEHQQAINAENWAHAQTTAQQNFGFARESNDMQREWASDQAQRAMNFTERMSSTAYQRAMSDMRNAGLNPILAYQQGGASAGQGTAGSASTVGASAPGSTSQSSSGAGASAPHGAIDTGAAMGRAISNIASSAIDAYKGSKEAEFTGERTKLTGKQTETQDEQTGLVNQTARKVNAERFKIAEETANVKEMNDVIKAQKDLVKAQSAGAYAAASKALEETRQFQRNGLPGYGLGERLGRSLLEFPNPIPFPQGNKSW